MSPSTVFQIASNLVLVQWLLMIVAPRWFVTQWLIKSCVIPVVIAVIYATYLFSGGPINFSDFGSLEGVKKLFATASDSVMLAGWVHYLAFDLMVGSWVLGNSHEHGISHWLIIPCLFFCFMLGPVGLLLYWIIRTIKTKQLAA